MCFQFKIPQNGREKNLRAKQTTKKGLLMVLDAKVLTER